MNYKDVKYLQKLAKSPELRNLEWAKCYRDPYYWLTNWAYTLDVHDDENPQKPFPDKEYLRFVVDKWLKHQIIIAPKSRQMMMSWLFVALYLWDTQFHFGRLTFFQSKKADDANDLVKRAYLIWDNEPNFLKRYYKDGAFHELKCNPHNQGNHTYSLLTFPDIKSEIRGVPEGGDVVRMHTLSGMLCLGPETKVLTSNSRWVRIDSVKVGDKLVAFDEEDTDGSRRWKNTTVKAVHNSKQPSYRLTFSDGTKIISSENHRWLVGKKARWVKTKDLFTEDRVWKVIDNKNTWSSKDGRMEAVDDVSLVKKEFIEKQEVVGLTTMSGTFVAEGLASHNSDESGFQPEMASAYTALKPTLSSGGRLTCVSTAEDATWFEDAVFDKLEM